MDMHPNAKLIGLQRGNQPLVSIFHRYILYVHYKFTI